jgi:hypothetical protein
VRKAKKKNSIITAHHQPDINNANLNVVSCQSEYTVTADLYYIIKIYIFTDFLGGSDIEV